MENAVEAIESGTMSYRQAAREFGVKTSSLWCRMKGTRGKQARRGKPTKFSDAEEKDLAELLKNCAELGVPISTCLFMKVVRN